MIVISTVTSSPTVMPDGLRTASLSGSRYPPSLGNSDVVKSTSPMRAATGMTPQPYVAILRTSWTSSAASSGSGR